ncbi:MAG TPA: M1 family aminopeptidase [Bacteroidia bacterium]|nr:M1 family aminopeptidase [Bacteroidia bacterium]
MKKTILLLAAAIFIITSCKTTKQTATSTIPANVEEKKLPEPKVYWASASRLSDILHQELRVSFDWDKKYLFGQSTLTIKPYFYSADSLYLNARGMEIKEVSLLSGEDKKPLNYKYENDSLKIKLDKIYTRDGEYKIFIDYTSKPDELKDLGGSEAINSDKGLYFINADGKEKNKPRQIWTQGETQSNSVWFPTIDAPNERMTQEIYITVDTSFVTLSNGLLISSIVNGREGTRTDYWKQTVPAAPYLTMMAISNFKIVKDKWRNKEVNYYVDPEYEKHAKMIFGNTPEMMEFFSKKLGVDFAWEKYAQVVVHDYVSGAMENASATLHGEFLQRDDRAYLDETYEDVVSHELFHQWFGDLVTCESWSNIPLNESFATYGEYLWNENKYGREAADYGLMNDLSQYLGHARTKNVNLVRYDYEERESIFDAITYQKGARILHMLRKYVGDEAFFKSLNLYLTANRLKPVEIHNLRLAFEEVTGLDLNWFFNQWFFNHGHPDLNINYVYDDNSKTESVIIEQKQDFEKDSLFSFPIVIDIYANGKPVRYNAWVTHIKDTLTFKVDARPDLVNVDAEKMLVCTKKDNHTTEEWIYQYKHAPLFLDRYEAIQKLGKNYEAESEAAKVIMSALNDKSWGIRNLAIKNIGTLAKEKKEDVKKLLVDLAKNDPKAAVREAALSSLSKNYADDSDLTALYENAVNDRSYDVMEKALKNLVEKDKEKGLSIAKKLEPENNKHIKNIVIGVYAEDGSDENLDFVREAFNESSGNTKYETTLNYGKFLLRCKPATIEKAISDIEDVAKRGDPWWVRIAGIQAMSELAKSCKDKYDELSKTGTDGTNAGKYKDLSEMIDKNMKAIKEAETDKNLKRFYGRGE